MNNSRSTKISVCFIKSSQIYIDTYIYLLLTENFSRPLPGFPSFHKKENSHATNSKASGSTRGFSKIPSNTLFT